jgi:ABC-type sugar transport system substrate-binding protein
MEMSERELVELEEELGLSRRDLFIKGGVLAAGTTLLGTPAAAAATRRAQTKLSFAVVTHGAGDVFWAVVKKGVNKAASDLGVSASYSESFNNPRSSRS